MAALAAFHHTNRSSRFCTVKWMGRCRKSLGAMSRSLPFRRFQPAPPARSLLERACQSLALADQKHERLASLTQDIVPYRVTLDSGTQLPEHGAGSTRWSSTGNPQKRWTGSCAGACSEPDDRGTGHRLRSGPLAFGRRLALKESDEKPDGRGNRAMTGFIVERIAFSPKN